MRTALAAREEERATFRGTFTRFGTKRGWEGREAFTVLLIDIRDARGQPVCDHLWLNLTLQLERLGLEPGDIVQFDARVKAYTKGYFGRRTDGWEKPIETDYKLSHPTKVQKITTAPPDDTQLVLVP